MAIQVLIGGQDYTQYTDVHSIKIESNIAVTSDTVDIDIIIPQRVVPRPKGGQEIKILNGSNIEFGGVVTEPEEEALATDRMLYHVKGRDYVYWLDKKTVTNTYTNYSAGNIVKDIVANYTTGFTSNNVKGTDSSYNITQIKFDHEYPSKIIKKLADDTGFQWWVDYNKDVHFGPTNTWPSPLPNNTLLPDTDTANYSNLKFTEDVSQVRNQIYLRGYKLPANYSITQSFVADGQNNTFTLTYEPKHSLSSITVKVGGTTQTNKLDLSGGQPNAQTQDNTAYVHYKNKTVRFNVAPSQGTVVSVTYVPMFEMISMYNDPNAMQVMKQRDLQDGVYEYAVRDQQLTSTDQTLANIRGQLELAKYAYPHITGEFESFLQGWQPGQYFYLTSNNRMDGQFQNQIFYVVKVEKTIVSHPQGGSPTFKYLVSFSDTPYVF
jgi:hypothetical protein